MRQRFNMAEQQKRPRKENFTHGETLALIEAYAERKSLLQSKFKSNTTLRDKNAQWDAVTAAVNAVAFVPRSKKECQQVSLHFLVFTLTHVGHIVIEHYTIHE